LTVSAAAVAALSLLPGMCGADSVNDPAAVSAQIRALELAHNEAIARGDVAAVRRMTSDDFTLITQRGFLIDREHMLSGLARGEFRNEYRQISDLRIRLYGDSAVVTGLSLHTVQENGKESTDAYRYTRVYVRRSGQWLAVAWQVTVDDEDDIRRRLRKD
jgi:hypothetical protein